MPNLASFELPRKTQTAYVVFQDSKVHSLAHRLFSEPCWRHCWLMLPIYCPEPGLMADVFTLKLESMGYGIDTEVWWQSPDVAASEFLKAGVTVVVKFPFTTPLGNRDFKRRGHLNCVSVVKATLMVNEWKVLTPKQLFRYLVANGGSIFEPELIVGG